MSSLTSSSSRPSRSSSSSATNASSSASFPSSLTVTTTSSPTPPTPSLPPGPGTGTGNNGGGGGGNQNQNQNNNNGVIATSASLYLYTFLATLVLLLSVSAAIVIRSFILRRRHRLMIEEAIRNGTWVPPAPALRPAKVDLSKKPRLWEAFIDKRGDLVGYAAVGGAGRGGGKGKKGGKRGRYMRVGGTGGGEGGEGKTINEAWRVEMGREWDLIRPFAAAYLPPSSTTTTTGGSGDVDASSPARTLTRTSVSGTTTPVAAATRLATIPSVGSLRAASATNGGGEAGTQTPTPPQSLSLSQSHTTLPLPQPTPSDSGLPVPVTTPTPTPAATSTPRYRTILSRLGHMLNPTPAPSSPLPAPLHRSNAGSTTNLAGSGEGIQMEEIGNWSSTNGPPGMVRVAVLIAMPSPPVVGASDGPSQAQTPLINGDDVDGEEEEDEDEDEDQPLPHIEVGVADVLLVPASSSSASSGGEGGGTPNGKDKLGKNRESVWSGMSEGTSSE